MLRPGEIESNAQKGKGSWWKVSQTQPLSGMGTYMLFATSILGNSNKDGMMPIFLRNKYLATDTCVGNSRWVLIHLQIMEPGSWGQKCKYTKQTSGAI